MKYDGSRFPKVIVGRKPKNAVRTDALRRDAEGACKALCPKHVKPGGDKHNGCVFADGAVDDLPGKDKVFVGAGGALLFQKPAFIDAFFQKIAVHGSSFRDVFARALASRKDQQRFRVFRRICCSRIKPPCKGQGDPVPTDAAAKHDERIRIPGRLCMPLPVHEHAAEEKQRKKSCVGTDQDAPQPHSKGRGRKKCGKLFIKQTHKQQRHAKEHRHHGAEVHVGPGTHKKRIADPKDAEQDEDPFEHAVLFPFHNVGMCVFRHFVCAVYADEHQHCRHALQKAEGLFEQQHAGKHADGGGQHGKGSGACGADDGDGIIAKQRCKHAAGAGKVQERHKEIPVGKGKKEKFLHGAGGSMFHKGAEGKGNGAGSGHDEGFFHACIANGFACIDHVKAGAHGGQDEQHIAKHIEGGGNAFGKHHDDDAKHGNEHAHGLPFGGGLLEHHGAQNDGNDGNAGDDDAAFRGGGHRNAHGLKNIINDGLKKRHKKKRLEGLALQVEFDDAEQFGNIHARKCKNEAPGKKGECGNGVHALLHENKAQTEENGCHSGCCKCKGLHADGEFAFHFACLFLLHIMVRGDAAAHVCAFGGKPGIERPKYSIAHFARKTYASAKESFISKQKGKCVKSVRKTAGTLSSFALRGTIILLFSMPKTESARKVKVKWVLSINCWEIPASSE